MCIIIYILIIIIIVICITITTVGTQTRNQWPPSASAVGPDRRAPPGART